MKSAKLIVLLTVVGLVSACSSGEKASESSSVPNNSPSASSSATATQSSELVNPLEFQGITVTGEMETEPVIEVGSTAKPATKLQTADILVGTGTSGVVKTSAVYAHYVGVGLNTGKKFDSSWEYGQPVEFGLDQVIPGWTEGLVGMKKGGRRLLVIPAEMAYGSTPPDSSGIEVDETLIFVVDLIDFQ